MCTHLFIFLLRDNQFCLSTIVLYTQEHSNTPCWGIKKQKKYQLKLSQRRDKSTVFNIPSSRPNFKWTPYVKRTCAKVVIFFLYFKTYLYLANTFITRTWSPQLRPLVTQIFFFFCGNCKSFNYRWSFLIHESCIALKSCSVEKNGSFRYFLPELSNCFHVYSSHFKKVVI